MSVASVVGWLGVVAASFPVVGRLMLSALGLGTIALLYVFDRRDCNAAAAESDD